MILLTELFMIRARLYSSIKPLFTFRDLGVSPELESRLALKNVVSPSPLQKSLLPIMQAHSDIILKDETGSGKTLGLLIGLLSKKKAQTFKKDFRIDVEQQKFIERRTKNRKHLSSLIIVPTRYGY